MKTNKVMLIFDDPANCGNCPCFGGMCKVEERVIERLDARPDWCPLYDLDMTRTNAILKILRSPLLL